VEHLADYITEIFEYAYGVGLEQVAMYAHASAGCLHVRPVVNLKSATGMRQIRQIAEKSVELVRRFNGTTSGEHGEGIVRGEFSHTLFGPDLIQAFRQVKTAFDPDNHLNPGKMFDAPAMDDESIFRYGSKYQLVHQPGSTAFKFAVDGSFAAAVEMCNGAGVCRKPDSGVMCPSFQATRDEKHSTRGRANALRAAMMGELGKEGLTSEELYQVLDLCLSCHACKSECPSAVDMAKIKAEFTYQYYKEHGVPLRAWLFANIGLLYGFAQPFSPLVNGIMGSSGKWFLTRLGIHPERAFPRLTSQTFSAWYRSQEKNYTQPRPAQQVVFFHDTFMEYNEPQIGKAALKVLQAAGYEAIILKKKKDSGRPAVSKGLLDTALSLARHNIALLAPYARKGIPITGCEPSVMAMLVDEYPDLVPGEDTEAIAQQTMMFEAFIVQGVESGEIQLNLDQRQRQVLYHGHCQQKAVFGVENTLKMLRLIPGCTVEMVESGCCGMAGSFGYEQEHYDLSIQLAEMALAPAVRAASSETIICASGTSCREQIHHTTGKHALHPVEVLAASLV
jgi:Fe-S oxidoreductase